jgi:hypothetical protein
MHDDAVVVRSCGHVRLFHRRHRSTIYVSEALAGYPIGVRELESGSLLLTFANLDLGQVDPETMTFHRADELHGHSPNQDNV